MSFEEFVRRRLPELLRFALVLCGSSARAEEVVVEVLARGRAAWPDVLVVGRPFAVLRTGVVRCFLLGGDAVPAANPHDALDALGSEGRAALVLRHYSGQSDTEIAGSMRRDADEIRTELAAAESLLAAAGAEGATALRTMLDELADNLDPDPDRLASTVRGLLDDDADRNALPSVDMDLFAPVWVAPRVVPVGVPDPGPRPRVASDDPRTPRRGRTPRRTGWPAGVLVLALIVAAGVTVWTSRGGRGMGTGSPTPRPVAPSPTTEASTLPGAISSAITVTLPGGVVVAQFFGAGSREIRLPLRTPGAGRELALNGVCSGAGSAVLGVIELPHCDGVPRGLAVAPAQAAAIQVSAEASTTWRLVLVDEPVRGTDAALASPPSGLLTSAPATDRIVAASGSGDRTLQLASGTTSSRVEDVRLLLTCSGSGVSFASTDTRFDDASTRTCFRGWSYEFDVSGAVLPGTLRVRASAATSWTLAVVRR